MNPIQAFTNMDKLIEGFKINTEYNITMKYSTPSEYIDEVQRFAKINKIYFPIK